METITLICAIIYLLSNINSTYVKHPADFFLLYIGVLHISQAHSLLWKRNE